MTNLLWAVWLAHWQCAVVGGIGGLVCLLVGMRIGARVGFALATGTRRRISDVAPEAPSEPDRSGQVPDLFKPEEDRRRQLLRQRFRERAGMLPWNYSRPGMDSAEREALLYRLETGKLDSAIDQIIREETEKS